MSKGEKRERESERERERGTDLRLELRCAADAYATAAGPPCGPLLHRQTVIKTLSPQRRHRGRERLRERDKRETRENGN